GPKGGFQVPSLTSDSPTVSLVSVGANAVESRAWVSNFYSPDAEVTASIYLGGTAPGYLFARGRDVNGDAPSYYAVTLVRGLELQVVRVVEGQAEVLATLWSLDWVSNAWVQVGLHVEGQQIRVRVRNGQTGEFLNA